MKKLIIVLLIVLGALTVSAQKVKVGADPGVDLTKYKTYAWDQGMAGTNPIVNQLIVATVDRAMATKGLTKVDSDPELFLAAWVSSESDLYLSNPSWAPSLNSINTGIVTSSQRMIVTKGTLVIDMSDARSRSGVWRGTATHTLDHGPTGDRAKDAKSVEKPIRKAVEKMFKQFPVPKNNRDYP
ncbi:MAG TPA: DUF4136 domain-containing protein [Pyrinomonadaceae bacterium]|nr:DUF4136 domain-containing protein [Pyrinomonadaceae bacterium]